jgi:hypothetical protein
MKTCRLGALVASVVFTAAGMGGCYTMLFHTSVRTADETTGTEQAFSLGGLNEQDVSFFRSILPNTLRDIA